MLEVVICNGLRSLELYTKAIPYYVILSTVRTVLPVAVLVPVSDSHYGLALYRYDNFVKTRLQPVAYIAQVAAR